MCERGLPQDEDTGELEFGIAEQLVELCAGVLDHEVRADECSAARDQFTELHSLGFPGVAADDDEYALLHCFGPQLRAGVKNPEEGKNSAEV